MDELTGLLNSSTYSACKVLDTEIVCPCSEEEFYTVSCKDCINRNDISINHTRLKEIIPILILRQEDE